MEIIAVMLLLGLGVSSTIPSSEKPKPKPSHHLKVGEAMLMVASIDKALSDDDRQKIDKAIEQLTKS